MGMMAQSALTPTGSTYRWRQLRKHYAAMLPMPCVRCGGTINPGDDFHLDHYAIPRNQGGDDSQIGPAHPGCNLHAKRKPTRPSSRGRREPLHGRAAHSLREQPTSTGDFQRDLELGLESADRDW